MKCMYVKNFRINFTIYHELNSLLIGNQWNDEMIPTRTLSAGIIKCSLIKCLNSLLTEYTLPSGILSMSN